LNEKLIKECETNEELEQIQSISGQENDRDCQMQGKTIQDVCDKRQDLVMASSERFPLEME
jgi:hypothetical protein